MSYQADTVVYAKPTGALDPSQRIPGVATYLAPDPADPVQYINVRLTNGAGYYNAGGTTVSGGSTLSADQGAPNLLSSAWPVKVTDGVSTFGTPGYPFYVSLSSASLGNPATPIWMTGSVFVVNQGGGVVTAGSGSVVGLLYGGVPAGQANPFWVTGTVTVANAPPSSVTVLSGSVSGLLVGGQLASQTNPLPTTNVASAATVSKLTSSLTSQLLVASNQVRRGIKLLNDSDSPVLVKFGPAATSDDFTFQLQAYQLWEPIIVYTGRIDAVWIGTATGSMRITELT